MILISVYNSKWIHKIMNFTMIWSEYFFFFLTEKFFFLTEKGRNLIHTHNSSWVILTRKSLDIYWAVSKLFCLSHFESILIPQPDPIVETIENSVSLFRNPLSLLCEIIGFRHYLGDPYSFQNGSNVPFFVISFYINRIRTIDSLLIHFSSK